MFYLPHRIQPKPLVWTQNNNKKKRAEEEIIAGSLGREAKKSVYGDFVIFFSVLFSPFSSISFDHRVT
jgi:hypothetical protein